MNLLSRQLLCERLRVNKRQSYRIMEASGNGLISNVELLELLNRVRVAMDVQLDVPTDLLTAEELEKSLGLDGVTARKIKAWTRREKNPIPHFHINKQTCRYPLSGVVSWLEKGARTR